MPEDANTSQTLALPAPSPADDAPKLDVNSDSTLKFDDLGPLVVNTDGTLSRIANWLNMTEAERQRTVRVLVARNKIRIANQDAKEGDLLSIAGQTSSSGAKSSEG